MFSTSSIYGINRCTRSTTPRSTPIIPWKNTKTWPSPSLRSSPSFIQDCYTPHFYKYRFIINYVVLKTLHSYMTNKKWNIHIFKEPHSWGSLSSKNLERISCTPQTWACTQKTWALKMNIDCFPIVCLSHFLYLHVL